jgi:hypothetical protein
MQPAKQEALETIGKLPDDADMDEIMYRLYVLDKVRKGQKAVEDGRTITSKDLKSEIETW